MKSTKLTRTLFAGMMTCSMALTAVSFSNFIAPGATQTVLAADEDSIPATFNLNIHKLQVYDGLEIQNNGTTTIPGLDLSGIDGLPGVDFKIYNVTQEFYTAAEKNKDKTDDEIAKMLSDNWDYDNPQGTYVDTQTTNENGIASKELATKTEFKGNNVYSVYMFVEVADKKNPELSNTPFVTARPFLLGMNKALAKNPSVDLFAKNYGVQKDLMGENGPLTDGYYSYDVGDLLNYVSTSPFPTKRALSAESYTGFRFYDEMTKEGTDFVDVDAIYVMKDGAKFDVKEDFEAVFDFISSKDDDWLNGTRQYAGFQYSVDLTKLTPDKQVIYDRLVDNIAGKQLHFSYNMKINEKATPYESIGNKFYGYFTNKHGEQDTVDDAPPVETGGHKFVKKDSESKEGLEGASFIISKVEDGKTVYANLKDSKGGTLESTDGVYKPTTITWGAEDEATPIVSATGGKLEIYGLEAGSYKLKEIEAPTGYTFEDANTSFEVYDAEATTQTLFSKDVMNDPNNRILPITGGIGIVSFLAVGAMAMGGALYYKKKKA